MESVAKIITPELAQEILDKNTVNRVLSKARVAAYARDMKKGLWQKNGETISISKTGRLLNGQHRLNAIILSGTPQEMIIAYDVDDNVSVYDRGRCRNVTDQLLAEGMDKEVANNTIVGVAKLHYAIQKNEHNSSDGDVKEFLKKHVDSLTMISELTKRKTHSTKLRIRVSPICLALMYAYESGYDLCTLKRFCEIVEEGFYDSPSEISAIVFRNDILGKRLGFEGIMSRISAEICTEKALYDFQAGYRRKKSYSKWNEPIYSNNIIFKED